MLPHRAAHAQKARRNVPHTPSRQVHRFRQGQWLTQLDRRQLQRVSASASHTTPSTPRNHLCIRGAVNTTRVLQHSARYGFTGPPSPSHHTHPTQPATAGAGPAHTNKTNQGPGPAQRQRAAGLGAATGLPSSSKVMCVGARRWRLTGVSCALPASSNLKWRPAGGWARTWAGEQEGQPAARV